MKLILEKLDSELFTDEIKKELVEAVEAQVEVQVNEKALALVEAKEEAYEEYMLAQMTEMKTELEEKLDSYLEQVVESFIAENEIAMDEEIKKEKYNAVLEGFHSLLTATGVEITEIVEAKQKIVEARENENSEALLEANEATENLLEQVKVLKAQNSELLKTGLVQEEMAGLTVVQKEKFIVLAETIEFDATNPSKFITQLDAIKSAVSGTVTEAKESITKDEAVIVESEEVKEEEVVESKQSTKSKLYQTSARHLY